MLLPRLALVCALAILLLTPPAAAGGGWWSFPQVNRSTVAPGQRVEVEATVTFGSAAAAEEARESGRFHVYLLRDFDYSVVERAMARPPQRNWWSLGGAEAIHVGQVAVRVSDEGFGTARAAFTLPELPPARYHVMLCDAGCAEPLAEVIPTPGFTVVADPATARMAERVDDLERRLRNQGVELRAARADADTALVATRNRRSEVERLEARVSALEDEGGSSPRAVGWAYAGWLVAGVLIGALALRVLRRRRSRPARVAGWQPSDEELRELLSSEPAQR
jgi:hypothetical protein